jgi:hypothetical protein
MERVKWADQRKIAAFVRGLYGLDSVQAISQQVVQGMDTLNWACSSNLVQAFHMLFPIFAE